MLIRELPAELAGEAVDLWHRSGLTRPWNDPLADLQRAAHEPTSTVLAACGEDGSLIGTSMVGHDGHRGWVYYLAVTAEQQRHGVGRALMRASERWLAERGVPKVNVMVRTGKEDVLSFYTSLGYEDSAVVVLGRFLDE
jgi:GNAT superfamily N-acetyltransferase